MVNILDLARGTQIAYIPSHAEGDLSHPGVEFGFVTSVGLYADEQENVAFCRYWRKDLTDLRTKANSEATPISCLVLHESVPQWRVNVILDTYC